MFVFTITDIIVYGGLGLIAMACLGALVWSWFKEKFL